MKTLFKSFVILSMLFLIHSCCIGQIPTQYAYVDENCEAVLPDYLPIVVVSDNCEVQSITQYPSPGAIITGTINVEIAAVDASGNESNVFFDVVILDTIPPTIQLDPEWTGYTNKEVGDMYRSFYGHVQTTMTEANELVVLLDTLFYKDQMFVIDGNDYISESFCNVIPVPDTTRDAWWWGID